MPTRKSPRKGSLQFWPRKRAKKFLPSVNWKAISDNSSKNLKGFICYKAGMASALVKDNTSDSMTKDKEIIIPVTILECPIMRIFSIRFYKNKKVAKDILNSNIDKELKKKLKLPKKGLEKIENVKIEDYEDVSIICYSRVKDTNIKKKPDLIEIGLKGNSEEKINFIKENLNKDLSVENFFEKGDLIDVRGLTKGKGLCGPVKRFGIKLKSHKSEKGRRRPGSIGPWHPARVIFRVPMAGQLGMFTRVIYNNKIIELNKITKDNENLFKNIKNYGEIKTNYIIVKGSVQGPAKRQLIITSVLRPSKKTKKLNYDLIKLQ